MEKEGNLELDRDKMIQAILNSRTLILGNLKMFKLVVNT